MQEIENLRQKLAKEKENLASKGGLVAFSPTGPVSLGLVEAIVAVVEAQAREIEALKAQPLRAA